MERSPVPLPGNSFCHQFSQLGLLSRWIGANLPCAVVRFQWKCICVIRTWDLVYLWLRVCRPLTSWRAQQSMCQQFALPVVESHAATCVDTVTFSTISLLWLQIFCVWTNLQLAAGIWARIPLGRHTLHMWRISFWFCGAKQTSCSPIVFLYAVSLSRQ